MRSREPALAAWKYRSTSAHASLLVSANEGLGSVQPLPDHGVVALPKRGGDQEQEVGESGTHFATFRHGARGKKRHGIRSPPPHG